MEAAARIAAAESITQPSLGHHRQLQIEFLVAPNELRSSHRCAQHMLSNELQLWLRISRFAFERTACRCNVWNVRRPAPCLLSDSGRSQIGYSDGTMAEHYQTVMRPAAYAVHVLQKTLWPSECFLQPPLPLPSLPATALIQWRRIFAGTTQQLRVTSPAVFVPARQPSMLQPRLLLLP